MYLTRHSSSLTAPALLFIAAAAAFGCSKADKSAPSTRLDSASTTSASATSPSAGPTDITPVRGTVASVTDSVLTVSTASGDVRVSIAAPLDLYASAPATLSQVKESSFVGVTSVAQSDGSQRATEIHIFPEKLRGTGEGSYPMTQQGASAGGSHNTMTNGTVSSSRMTNGTATAPRMTNGTIDKQSGGTLTVQYKGGTQTIAIPLDVHVTEIAVSQAKLAPGAKVVVLAKKQSDGTLKASAAIMAGTGAKAK
jgi:hypothetical protein